MLPSWLAGNMMSSWIFSQFFLSLSLAADGCCLPSVWGPGYGVLGRGSAPHQNCSEHQRAPCCSYLSLASWILPTWEAAVLVSDMPSCRMTLTGPRMLHDAASLPWGLPFVSSFSDGLLTAGTLWHVPLPPYGSILPGTQSWEAFGAKFKHRHRLHLDFLLSLKARRTFWRAFCTC